MDAVFLTEWMNLLLRWAHIIAGVGWIGTSFYFVALDYALSRPEDPADPLMGEAWQVHGGGFYHVRKYRTAPEKLPERLLWYKWEAYLTWFTGFALLSVQYYWGAELYLIDRQKFILSPGEAVGLSVGSLIVGWLGYDLLCKRLARQQPKLLAVLLFFYICAFAQFYDQIFSGRGALIHCGVLIGTLMAVNVFGVIIPNQKRMALMLLEGKTPDPRLGEIGKQRSLHNNYLTLPVLILMISGHYSFLFSHPHLVLIVALILVLGGAVRHALNNHEREIPLSQDALSLPLVMIGLVLLILITAPAGPKPGDNAARPVEDSDMLQITAKHCVSCHARRPADLQLSAPPAGVVLERLTDIRKYSKLIMSQAVVTQAMPPGNPTGLTEDERERIGAWIRQQK